MHLAQEHKRALLQITENRKVEARKPLIFQDTVFEFSLEKATLRQNPWESTGMAKNLLVS